MKIAVVTPTYLTERSWLEQCLESVRRQTVACTHFLVNDGDPGLSAALFPGVEYVQLARPHEDNGNAARAIGSVSAIARGFEAIAYLDADNWFESNHLQNLVELHQRTGAAVCTASRNLVDLEGRLLGRCAEVDGTRFADTSSLLFTQAAFGLVAVWYRMGRGLAPACDRVMWKAIKDAKLPRAHHPAATVNFRTQYLAHYTRFGLAPPAKAKHVQLHVTPAGEFVSAETSIIEARGQAPFSAPTSPVSMSRDLRGAEKGARPLISMCMIVKDEEANLAGCLAPIADLFQEIVIVDTGSRDETRECARRFGAKVVEYPWQDSFSAARNESHRHATGDWIFWLDADERLDFANLAKLRALLSSLPSENQVYLMCQASVADAATGVQLVVDQARLYRNLPQARWRYRVHEQILLTLRDNGAREARTDIHIQHLGYEDAETRRQKRERNLRLLRMDLEDSPHDAFVLYNVGNCHLDAGEVEEAIAYFTRCLEHAPSGVSYLPKTYALLAGGHQFLGRAEEAMRLCRKGKEQFPHSAMPWFQEGMLLLAAKDLAGARRCFEMVLELPAQPNYIGTDAGLVSRARHNLAYVYRRLGLQRQAEEQWLQAIRENPRFEPPWLGLMELHLGLNRREQAEALLKRLQAEAYQDVIAPALQARLHLADQQLTAACRVLEEALLRQPRALWLRGFLVDVLLNAKNDKTAAEKHLRLALEQCPNDLDSRGKLAQVTQKR